MSRAPRVSLTLGNWKDVPLQADGQGVDLKKKKWQLLCTSEWPILISTWPKDGIFFNLDIVLQVKEWMFNTGPQGCLDQIPYIIAWDSLTQNLPS